MKSATQIEKEMQALRQDLKDWRLKLDRVDLGQRDGATKRQIVANTINALEGQLEALIWVLEDE